MRRTFTISAALALLAVAAGAHAQQQAARALLEDAADAMGGLERLRALDVVVLTGFGQQINQLGGSSLSPDPRAPTKWQAVRAAERTLDLESERALRTDRRSFLFPFAAEFGHSWNRSSTVQTGRAVLDHPLPAVLEALDPQTTLGAVRTEQGLAVVEFTIEAGERLWLAIDPATDLPAWVRWIAPSATLGDVTHTAYFTGYLPFDGIRLPVGLTEGIDRRDTTVARFHVDSYRIDVDSPPPFPDEGTSGGFGGDASREQVEATEIADGVWDVRIRGNGGAVVEFDDHLTMFEAYGSEAATFARLDLANTLVPGKRVTEVIVSHHHFDHTGGLRAAVSRGLTIIAHRGNEELFRELVSRPAPSHPDALARNPQPLDFVAVDEHLVLEEDTMRLDVHHAVGHLHMANAVFAYVPEHRMFLEGDFTTLDWDWHWWGGAYLDSVERYGLDPAINVPVHGAVSSFADAIGAIEAQVERARAFCADRAAAGYWPAAARCGIRERSRDRSRSGQARRAARRRRVSGAAGSETTPGSGRRANPPWFRRRATGPPSASLRARTRRRQRIRRSSGTSPARLRRRRARAACAAGRK